MINKKDVDLFLSTFGLLGVAVSFTLKMERVRVTELTQSPWLPLELLLPRPGSPLPEWVRQTLRTAHYQQLHQSWPKIINSTIRVLEGYTSRSKMTQNCFIEQSF